MTVTSPSDPIPGDTAAARTLSVVLPAYNEAASIERVITEAVAVVERLPCDFEIVVVDDGSTDETAQIIEKLSAADPRIRLLQHDVNRGYGGALKSGFLAASKELVFFTDADGQFDFGELGGFLDLIQSVDVVAGYRINRCDPLVRRLNARAWNYLVRMLFYVPVRDIDCAFKLFRREVFDGLELESVGAMVNTELMVKIGRSGYRLVEVGVSHYPRRAGVARGAHPKVIIRAFVELARMHGRLATMEAGQVRATRRP